MRTTRVLLLAALVFVLCLSAGGDRGVQAQTSTGYNLEWHVIGGGGGPVRWWGRGQAGRTGWRRIVRSLSGAVLRGSPR